MRNVMDRLRSSGIDIPAGLLAVFAVVNVAAGAVDPALDGNWIWIDLHTLPGALAAGLMTAFAMAVLGYRRLGERGRSFARGVVLCVALACLADTAGYFELIRRGAIQTCTALPLSLPTALLLLGWVNRRRTAHSIDPLVRRPVAGAPHRSPVGQLFRLAALAAVGVTILLAQILLFGATDYRRPADAIVVFGAAVRADGRPSHALTDRTRTACRLYRQGLARRLVLSGGRDPGSACSEPEAMRQIALDMGVAPEAIILDETGVNSAATIVRARQLSRRHGWGGVLMVSHDYHLSRIKLLSHRMGVKAYTVPAHESRPLRRKGYFVTRELAAWAYHFLTMRSAGQA